MKSIIDDMRNSKTAYSLLVVMALLLGIAVAFAACCSKHGFHEDEYYSFYSSNRSDGFWIEDGLLMDRQMILDEFSVKPSEGYNFGLVREVQSWDVHPPLYYFCLHLACSMMPGIFNMWQGLAINLVFFAVAMLLMLILSRELMTDRPYMAIVISLAWAVSASTLTAVVFIRMYMLLTVWILAVSLLHVTWLKNNYKFFWVLLGAITVLGFMTHYYFFIWLFSLAVCTNVYVLATTRRISFSVKYFITMVVSFGICYVFYPVWPAQMFHGQRGAQATDNFLNMANTWERLCFFAEKVNRIGYGGLYWVLLLAMMVAILGVFVKKNQVAADYLVQICIFAILFVATVMYYLIVSKTALMLGDSSIRYQMPVLGVSYIAVTGMVVYLGQSLITRDKALKLWSYAGIAIGVALLIANIISDLSGNISFLYPEERDHRAQIEEYTNSDGLVMYAYDPSPSEVWCIWDSTRELLEAPEVFFSSGDMAGEISDVDMEVIGAYDQILMYVDRNVDAVSIMHKITAINPRISTMTPLFSHQYCDVYICN